MAKMILGYIQKYDLELNPQLTEQFALKEATYTRSISSRGDKIKSKLFYSALDYEDVASTTEIMKENGWVVIKEPFFMDDELRERVTKWIEWANHADPSEYDPFAKKV